MADDVYSLEEEPATKPAAPVWPDIVPDGPRCRRCAYELKGLPMGGACPECGLAVVRSLRGNLLAYSDPAYVRRLARGAMLVELGIVAICAVPIGAVGLVTIIMVMDLPEAVLVAARAVAVLVSIAAGVLGLVGLFVLTARDPAFVGQDESDRSRLITRIATVVCSGCWGAGAVISALPTVAAVAPGAFSIAMRTAGIVLLIAFWVQVIASMVYLRHLAVRLPDKKLREEITASKAVAVAAAVCFTATVLLAMSRLTSCFAGVGGLLGAVLFLVFLTRYADIVDRMRRKLTFIASMEGEATP